MVRIIPQNLCANIYLDKIKIKPIFKWIKSKGVSDFEMLKTFNCGVGFCFIVKKNINKVKKYFNKEYKPYVIGHFISIIKKIKFYLMKKLNGNLKKNIAVFISGRGSNLKSIIRYSSKKKKLFIK